MNGPSNEIERAGQTPDPSQHDLPAREDVSELINFALARAKVSECADVLLQGVISAVDRFGIKVRMANLDDKQPGDLDGKTITLDTAKDRKSGPVPIEPVEQLFILLHLFGHTYQWNNPNEAMQRRDVDIGTREWSKEPWYVNEAGRYEREANQYALALFRDTPELVELLEKCGISQEEFAFWLSYEFHRDWIFLKEFYESEGGNILGKKALLDRFVEKVLEKGALGVLVPKSFYPFSAEKLEDTERQVFAGEDE